MPAELPRGIIIESKTIAEQMTQNSLAIAIIHFCRPADQAAIQRVIDDKHLLILSVSVPHLIGQSPISDGVRNFIQQGVTVIEKPYNLFKLESEVKRKLS